MIPKKYLIVLGGATASGKTEVAISLAKHFDTVILSADSRQFYRELSIGTAKPSSEQLKEVKHYFIDNLSIHESYSVGDYEEDALKTLQEIYQKKSIAVLTGGSGLFIQAVCEGLDSFPEVSLKIKYELEKKYEQEGIEALQQELLISDPEYYKKVDLQNPHRLMRALGVIRASREPYSSFLSRQSKLRPFIPIYILLELPREELYERINHRVEEMIEKGLEEEVAQLRSYEHLNALQTVGYQEFFDYFHGLISKEEAIDLIKRNSRRYAKRQMTWFRRNDDWQPFHPSVVKEIIVHIEDKMTISN
jgi:tRNA dimethylallyltransferase